ncbi:MAG: hypothetical protein MRJ96_08700 [Nitrospirales bacterium]|nr:hypothetical protein [Nitrospira sp.]MDR4501512.1 hypothetical protein [Nitrospirales bacterium]
MRGKILTAAYVLVALGLLTLNAQVLDAHQWGSWHWDKRTLGMYYWGSHQTQAKASVQDWDSHTDLSLPTKSSHTDISVFGQNSGATGWAGLASIKSYEFDWWHKWCWCRIKHAHAQYNSYYGYSNSNAQGVFCQEVGHTFGLDHSNTNGCMAKGYYSPSSNVSNSHNWSDINSMY